MKMRLNARVVEDLKPQKRQYAVFDEREPGFCVRVTPTGHKSYACFYRFKGRLRLFTIGEISRWSFEDARKKARDAKRDSEQGKDQAAIKKQERQAETFGDVAKDFIERYAKKRKKEKSWREDERMIEKFLNPHFQTVRAADVKRREVRAVLEKIAVKTPIQANRVLACIRKMYNWAVSEDLIETNPISGIQSPGKPNRRDRVLSEDEIRELWRAFDRQPSMVSDIFKLRLLTAQRGNEIVGMQWTELDLPNQWWTIPQERSKNKLTHRVWLSDPAMKILKRIEKRNKKLSTPWVFPGRNPAYHLAETRRRTMQIPTTTDDGKAISHWTWHDLRRTAASLMTGMGIARLVVAKILNHAEPEVTATYDRHSYDPEKKDALDRWASRLMTIVVRSKTKK